MEDKTFLFTYYFKGAHWELPVQAKTLEEARERLSRAPYAVYTGELVASIPVPSSSRFLSRIASQIRNWLSV